ncbi:MAG: hypothetical protein GYA18_09580 [Chloroflexi bacterium]|jgi:hypothetical protein|nr:hypothetical protein [Chloroflexota bacterium]
MDIPLALKNAQNVLCFDTERSFLRTVTNPVFDFIKSASSSKDCSFSFRIQNGNEQEYAQVQHGSNSAALSYGFSCQRNLPHILFDALSHASGSVGKCHLLANVPVGSDQYTLLSSNAFHTYSVQKLWWLDHIPPPASAGECWNYAKDEHQGLISSFYSRFISPMESSLQSWNFSDVFHLVLNNPGGQCSGIARIRYFTDRAVVMPMLENGQSHQYELLGTLLREISRIFNTILISESIHHPLDTVFLDEHAHLLSGEEHFMVRNLTVLNPLKNFQNADFLEERGIAKPSTPFSHP